MEFREHFPVSKAANDVYYNVLTGDVTQLLNAETHLKVSSCQSM